MANKSDPYNQFRNFSYRKKSFLTMIEGEEEEEEEEEEEREQQKVLFL
jgi:hypothetical protein